MLTREQAAKILPELRAWCKDRGVDIMPYSRDGFALIDSDDNIVWAIGEQLSTGLCQLGARYESANPSEVK